MSVIRNVVFFSGLVIVGGVLFVGFGGGTHDEVKPRVTVAEKVERSFAFPKSNENENTEMRNSISQIHQKLEKLETENQALKKSLTELSQSGSQAPETEPAMVTSETEPVENTLESFQAHLDNEFVDFEWAGQAEDDILQAVELAFADSGMLSVDEAKCQMTVCKVNMRIKDSDSVQRTLDTFSSTLEWGSDMYTEYDVTESGEVVAQAFIMRDGHVAPESVR